MLSNLFLHLRKAGKSRVSEKCWEDKKEIMYVHMYHHSTSKRTTISCTLHYDYYLKSQELLSLESLWTVGPKITNFVGN